MKNSRLSAFPEDNPKSRTVAYVVSFARHVLAVTVPITHWHLPVTLVFFFLTYQALSGLGVCNSVSKGQVGTPTILILTLKESRTL